MDVHLCSFLAATTLVGSPALSPLWALTLIVIFFLLTVFCSACEDSFLALDKDDLKVEAKAGRKSAKRLLRIVERPRGFLRRLSAMRSLFMMIIAAVCFSISLTSLLGVGAEWNLLLEFVLFLILLFLLQFLAGQLPRKLVALRPHFAHYAYPFYRFLAYLVAPLLYPGMALADVVLRAKGIDPEEPLRQLTEQELREFIDQGRLDTDMPDEEQDMLENIFEFGDKTADEVMTHRMDVVAVPDDVTAPELLALIHEEKFTRMPVYHEDIDHIIGILNARDFLLAMAEDPETFDLERMMREPYYAPESMKISPLFRAMQKERTHLAVVIDEYGGTAGIVTIEDLLEEIVGQIQDEYDEELPEIEALTPTVYLVQGQADLADLGERIYHDFPEDYDTVAGLVLDLLDRIPEEGEQPIVEFEGIKFQVMTMEDKRIERLRVTLPKAPEPKQDEDKELYED